MTESMIDEPLFYAYAWSLIAFSQYPFCSPLSFTCDLIRQQNACKL